MKPRLGNADSNLVLDELLDLLAKCLAETHLRRSSTTPAVAKKSELTKKKTKPKIALKETT